jgi:DNA-binding MarR family transcriptional regulator
VTKAESDRTAPISSLIFEVGEAGVQTSESRTGLNRTQLLVFARAEARRRLDRREVFGQFDMLSDPAWDILLELYIADATGSPLYASVIGSEAEIPQSTALRWLTVLEKSGLVRRRHDVFDKRRQWVGLTPRGRTLMERHFSRSR